MDRLGSEQVAGDQANHARRAAAVLAEVDDEGVGVGEEGHRGDRRVAAEFGPVKPAEIEVADVPLKPFDLLEAEIGGLSARAMLPRLAVRRLLCGPFGRRGVRVEYA